MGRLSTKAISRGYSCIDSRFLTHSRIPASGLFSGSYTWFQHHEGLDDLGPDRVRFADGGGELNMRVPGQTVLDLTRADAVAG